MRDLSFIKNGIIAHRGLYNNSLRVPENSILAFEKAIKNGYSIELDVHVLKDGKVVVFHDDSLLRMTGVNKKIKDTNYEEIKDLKLMGSNEKIPLFSEVLKIVNGKVPILIELKYDTKLGSLEDKLMETLKEYKGKIAVQSFNPLSIYYMKRKYPEVIRGQISSDLKEEKMNFGVRVILKNMLFNFLTKPDFISYDIRSLPNRKVEKYRKKHPVLCWTIRNKKELEFARRYADNFICENIN